MKPPELEVQSTTGDNRLKGYCVDEVQGTTSNSDSQ